MLMAESLTFTGPQISTTSSSSSSSSSLPKLNPNVRCRELSDGCSSAQLMIQNRNNFNRSAAPVRFMFYRACSWVDFQSEVLDSLRSGFVEVKPAMEVAIRGANYAFDFVSMVQVDLGSGSQRSIAWIDENGKPFFPKVFLDEDFSDEVENSRNPMKIEVEIRIGGHARGVKRKSEHVGLDEVNGSKWPNAKLLIQNDRTYSHVSDLFLPKINEIDRGATITSIHEFVVSKARSEVFERQKEITEAARGSSNVVYAWYAATAEGVVSVLTHGFGLHSKNCRLPAYGVGIYLSHVGSPHLSGMQSEADNNGEKHIILCRVILGNVEKLETGSQQTRPSSVDFDTGSDDPNNPKWYVVWSSNMNTHIFPVCVVSYKTSTHVTGQLGSSSCRKLSLTKLLLEMKKRLPSSKLQEVGTVYGTFKSGKLEKEIFIKQLRAITGDEMLMSIIREIRSSG